MQTHDMGSLCVSEQYITTETQYASGVKRKPLCACSSVLYESYVWVNSLFYWFITRTACVSVCLVMFIEYDVLYYLPNASVGVRFERVGWNCAQRQMYMLRRLFSSTVFESRAAWCRLICMCVMAGCWTIGRARWSGTI